MQSVPKDVLLLIFSYLPTHSLCSCSLVCKLWSNNCWTACSLLSFTDNSFTQETFKEKFPPLLTKCYNAKGWEFSRCTFVNETVLASFANNLKTLKSLHLIGCPHISSKICKVITTHCSALEELNLKDSKRVLMPVRFADIVLPSTLKSLNVQGCIHVTDDIVHKLTVMCSNLQAIKLKGCYRLTDTTIKHVLGNLPNLQALGIEGQKRMSNIGFSILKDLKRATLIHTIDMRMCDSVDDDTIATLAAHCPNLKNLILKFCPRLTNNCANALTQLPRLQHLDLQGTVIGDEGMNTISTDSKVTSLDLRDCRELTVEGYKSISKMKSLQLLRLRSPKVDDAGVLAIIQGCLNLTLLDVEGTVSEDAANEIKACKHITRLSIQ